MTKRTIPAGRFKAECLGLIDRVARTWEPLIVASTILGSALLITKDERLQKSAVVRTAWS